MIKLNASGVEALSFGILLEAYPCIIQYRAWSAHQARFIGFNSADGLDPAPRKERHARRKKSPGGLSIHLSIHPSRLPMRSMPSFCNLWFWFWFWGLSRCLEGWKAGES